MSRSAGPVEVAPHASPFADSRLSNRLAIACLLDVVAPAQGQRRLLVDTVRRASPMALACTSKRAHPLLRPGRGEPR